MLVLADLVFLLFFASSLGCRIVIFFVSVSLLLRCGDSFIRLVRYVGGGSCSALVLSDVLSYVSSYPFAFWSSLTLSTSSVPFALPV